MTQHTRYESLRGLKGLAIYLIVLFHTIDVEASGIPLFSLVKDYGNSLGNALFFMLSGFLIASGYRQRVRERAVSFRAYLLGRVIRLYPLYVLTNVVCLIQIGFRGFEIQDIFLVLTMQTMTTLNAYPYNISTWFVCAVFVCYLLHFLLARFTRTDGQYAAIAAVLAGLGLILFRLRLQLPYLYSFSGNSYLCFFTGCLLNTIFIHSQHHKPRIRSGLSLAMLVAVPLLILTGWISPLQWLLRCYQLTLCPFLILLALDSQLLRGLLTRRPVLWLGDISTSVFYWHISLYWLLQGPLLSGPLPYMAGYALYLLAVVGASAVSYYLIERNVNRLRQYIR